MTEAHLDGEVLAVFDRLRVADPEVRDWFLAVLRAKTRDEQATSREPADELQRQLSLIRQQQDRLLNMRLREEIDADTYAGKATEHRDRVSALELQLQACSRSRQETAELAIKTFEL